MENEFESKEAKWFDFTSSARGFLRGVTVLTAAGLLYFACGAMYKLQTIGSAMLGVGSISALMVLFSICHAITPAEVSELYARTSARGILRWLALCAGLGYSACALFTGFWLHDFASAQWCNFAGLLSMVAFTVTYGFYCNCVSSDKVASKRSISRYGSGRIAMIQTTGLTALSFALVGLSAKDGRSMLESIAMVAGTMCVFAVANGFFTNQVDIDDDRI